MTLERGTLLNNRYRIVEILGQGGMGSVYRAVDENLGVEIALKENLFTTEEYARQFHREAVILATLRHPNLTRVTDHFVIEGQGQYLVMDYIEGEDLRQRMDRIGLLNEDEAIIIGAAICDALTYMHTRTPAVVHRDIKPGNVKITPQGQIFIVDFGLAKLVHADQATTTGARAMTPGYSPPEQYGTARTDHRSDIFSLGATLYAALTGAIPEDSLARTMDQTSLTPIRKRNASVSRRMASVLEKSLEVRPDDRYQTAEEFKQALLSVRGITTRRRTGNYKVEPPPVDLPEKPALLVDMESEPDSSEYIAPPGSFAGLLLNGNASLGEAALPEPRRSSGWLAFSLFLLFVVAVGAAAYIIYPSWPSQALALVRPMSTTSVPVVILDSSATPSATRSTPQATQALTTLTQDSGTDQGTNLAAPDLPTLTATPRPSRTPEPPPPSPTATLTPTQIGGGSGQIAFASDRSGTVQIWLMNTDGSAEPQQITDLPEGACQPDWSPDGLQLVFISPCSGQQPIYQGAGMFLTNADGTGMTPLPNVYGGDFDPAWSPDGRYIAFSSLRNSGRPRIYLLDLQDNTVERLS
ncbi:MAG TPA: protein kinase, partial [Anaerolineales bacterium]|nr:protein kinase [Anaerolineales bacterium]